MDANVHNMLAQTEKMDKSSDWLWVREADPR
jgi:hypothetical protein